MDVLLNQSIMGMFVLLVLIFMSVWSWAVSLSKAKLFKKVIAENKQFHDEFWKGLSFEELLGRAASFPYSTIAAMYREASNELVKVRQSNSGGDFKIENIERVLSKVHSEQLDKLETNLGFLGSIGSTAPFIGLFGTVVGIMMSFAEIGRQKSASLAIVAPGISEALIATAVGLFVAIPAVAFFNRFQANLKSIEQLHFSFQTDLLNILNRKYR